VSARWVGLAASDNTALPPAADPSSAIVGQDMGGTVARGNPGASAAGAGLVVKAGLSLSYCCRVHFQLFWNWSGRTWGRVTAG